MNIYEIRDENRRYKRRARGEINVANKPDSDGDFRVNIGRNLAGFVCKGMRKDLWIFVDTGGNEVIKRREKNDLIRSTISYLMR